MTAGTMRDHAQALGEPIIRAGRKARLGDETWEGPVLAQVAGIALDDRTIASVLADLGSSRQPVEIDPARIDRQIRELALEHAAGSLGDEAHLARLKVLGQQRDAAAERTGRGVPGQRAVEWLRALGQKALYRSYPCMKLSDRKTVC
ncbi:MAG TPA: hypothetical protein VLR46_15420 [Candidatus Dormibacteraeota bacterium]|nr:hypothetical protein [Candidatus Dormibacteraeota bacterium]